MNEEMQELLERYRSLEENFNHKCLHLSQKLKDLMQKHGALTNADYGYKVFERMLENGRKYDGCCE